MKNPWAKYTTPKHTATQLRALGVANGPCEAAASQIERMADALCELIADHDAVVAAGRPLNDMDMAGHVAMARAALRNEIVRSATRDFLKL